MKIIKEAIDKIPEITQVQVDVPVVMGKAKIDADEADKEFEKVVEPAEEFDRKADCAFGAEKQEKPEEAEKELKKIELDESLFDEAVLDEGRKFNYYNAVFNELVGFSTGVTKKMPTDPQVHRYAAGANSPEVTSYIYDSKYGLPEGYGGWVIETWTEDRQEWAKKVAAYFQEQGKDVHYKFIKKWGNPELNAKGYYFQRDPETGEFIIDPATNEPKKFIDDRPGSDKIKGGYIGVVYFPDDSDLAESLEKDSAFIEEAINYTAQAMKECGLTEEIINMRTIALESYARAKEICESYIVRCNEISAEYDDDYLIESSNISGNMDFAYLVEEVDSKKELEQKYLGKIIKVISMVNSDSSIDDSRYNGKEGIVKFIDDAGQLHGTWGGLAVIPEVDKFEIVG